MQAGCNNIVRRDQPFDISIDFFDIYIYIKTIFTRNGFRCKFKWRTRFIKIFLITNHTTDNKNSFFTKLHARALTHTRWNQTIKC